MDKNEFEVKIKKLAGTVDEYTDKLNTEEATKNALIMPFFSALGYNVFDPTEFIPEFTADFGSKKGERVDYAIKLNDDVQILVESKELTNNLEKNDSQLFRYFTATKARFGILTNGDTYKFYTDLEAPNVMDETPFLTVELSDLKDTQISELFKFTRENFDVVNITDTASDLKNVGIAKEYFREQLLAPSDDFVKFVLSNVYDGVKTQQVIKEFKPAITKGFNQIISERVNNKLSDALNNSVKASTEENAPEATTEKNEDSDIVTTPEELESYTVAKVIMRDIITPDRIFYRDNHSYFNVLVDDSNRKWVLRIFFRPTRNFVILHDENNTELEFNDPVDIYNFADQINAVAKEYI